VVVPGVAKLLRRALRNLLENARRYADGPVLVTIGCDGERAIVRVCDRGPGVPAAERERIFEPFYRLRGASEREGGVGLGLALVRSIAARHQGSAHCEDNPGGGACFVLALPREQM
jgi:signal transduction histidine kinase